MEARIIKGTSRPAAGRGPAEALDLSGGIVKRDLYQAHTAARALLDRAREEAAALRTRAESEADAIRNEAREAGYVEGLGQWNRSIAQCREAQARLMEEHRPNLLRLSVRIAERIIGRRLEQDPEAYGDILDQAIRSIRHDQLILLRVHPGDLPRARQAEERLQRGPGGSRSIEVRPDESVGSGGCIVETDLGTIDARLETQLRVLEKVLLENGR